MAANTRVDYPRNVFSFSELCLIWIVFAIAGDAELREIFGVLNIPGFLPFVAEF